MKYFRTSKSEAETNCSQGRTKVKNIRNLRTKDDNTRIPSFAIQPAKV